MGGIELLDHRGDPLKRTFAADAYSNPVARLGFGQENLMEATRYPMTRMSWDYYLLGSLYRGSWIARRIIDVAAEDMVKNWYKLTSKLTPEQTRRIADRERRTRTRAKILEGLKWGRLYGGAAAVMMIEGHEDILDEPLDLDDVMPGAYCGLLIVDRWSGIEPELGLVSDPRDEAFGLPEHYRISADGKNGARVHQSRILRFSGRDLPYWERTMENYWGAPELEHIFEELKKRDNTSWNIAQLVFMANLRVLKLKDMEQVLGTAPIKTQQALYRTIEAQNRLMNSQGLHVLGAEDVFETHAYAFGGLSEIYEAFMLDIAGAAEIPVTKLFGRSPAGLNATGESDMQNYYDSIEEKQEAYLRPVLERLLPVLCMSELGVAPDDLNLSFNPVRRPTETERKGLAKQTAEAVIGVYNSGLISDRVALSELKNASEATGMWGTISDEDIALASSVPNPAGEMSALGGVGLGFQKLLGEGFTAADAKFNESDHPRDNKGKFTEGGIGVSETGHPDRSDKVVWNPKRPRAQGLGKPNAKGANTIEKGFDPDSRRRHFESHRDEYPGLTEEKYETAARKLLGSPVGGDIQGFRHKDWSIVRFNKRTGDYVCGHPQSGIFTMMKPRYLNGRGESYFKEQVELFADENQND